MRHRFVCHSMSHHMRRHSVFVPKLFGGSCQVAAAEPTPDHSLLSLTMLPEQKNIFLLMKTHCMQACTSMPACVLRSAMFDLTASPTKGIAPDPVLQLFDSVDSWQALPITIKATLALSWPRAIAFSNTAHNPSQLTANAKQMLLCIMSAASTYIPTPDPTPSQARVILCRYCPYGGNAPCHTIRGWNAAAAVIFIDIFSDQYGG